MPGLRPVQTEADKEWVGWRKELEHRHKLTQDQKEYDEWVRAGGADDESESSGEKI
jgi:hypothetical protein